MDLAEFAGALDKAAATVETTAARECAAEGGHAFLVQLRIETPVLSGELRASEKVSAIRGGGTSAVATIGAYAIYAEFRNNGGTITVKDAKVLSDGHSFFGRSVTQVGNHYMERTAARAGPAIAEACQNEIRKILRDAGL